jgi:GNAT superfamily N-acetyltransferase
MISDPLTPTVDAATATMTDRALAATADRALRAAVAMDRPARADDDLVVAWQGDRGVFTNTAVVLAADPDWDALAARVAGVVPEDRPVMLVTAAGTPATLGPGWQFVGRPPLMVRAAGGAVAVADLGVRPVNDPHALAEFERALVEGYPDPTLQPYRFGDVYDGRVLGGATRFYVADAAGATVATASGHVAAGVNLVEMVTTRAEWRGRGFGAAVTWAAATTDPSLPAVLIASDLGRPVYERLGFVAVSRWTLWLRPGEIHA